LCGLFLQPRAPQGAGIFLVGIRMAFATSQSIDQILTRGLSFRLPNNAPISSLYTLYANGAGMTYWSNSINPRDLSTLSSAIGELGSTVTFQQGEINDLYGQVSTLSTALVDTSNALVDYFTSTITGISTFSTFYNDLGLLSNVVQTGFSTLSTAISAGDSTVTAYLTSTLTSSMNGLVLSSSTGLYNYTNRVSSATVFNTTFYSTVNNLNSIILSTSTGLNNRINATNVSLSTNIQALRTQTNSTNANFFSTISGYGPRIGRLETASTGISTVTNNWISTQIGISQSSQDAFYTAQLGQLSSYISTIAVFATAQFGSLSTFSTALYASIAANNSTNDTQNAQISTLARNLSILTTSSILAGVYDTFIQLEAYTVNLINSTVATMYFWQSSLFNSTIIQNQVISQAYFSTFTATAYLSTVSAATGLTNAYVSTYTSTAVGILYSTNTVYINNVNSTTIGTLYSTGYNFLVSSLNVPTTQQSTVVFIGSNAGSTMQQAFGVAIGANAGRMNQGRNAIAIGNLAGQTNQSSATIVLNASGAALNTAGPSSFFVAPIRNDETVTGGFLHYNTATKEIVYNAQGGGGGGGSGEVMSTFTMPVYMSTINGLGNLYVNTLSYGTGSAFTNFGTGGTSLGFPALTRGLSCSSNGQYVLAPVYENNDLDDNLAIKVSANYGTSFTDRLVSSFSGGIQYDLSAISGSGQHMVVLSALSSNIFISADYGVTWSIAATSDFTSVAINTSGQYVVAVDQFGNVDTSDDYGVTWANNVTTGGSSQIRITDDGVIYTNDTNVLTAQPVFPFPSFIGTLLSGPLTDFDIDATGKYILIGDIPYLKVSSDYGMTFTTVLTNGGAGYARNTVSRNGQCMLSIDMDTGLYMRSFDFGVSWSAITSPAIASTGNPAIGNSGEIAYLVDEATGAGDIYRSSNAANAITISTLNKVGINNTSPQYTLDVSGKVRADTIIVSSIAFYGSSIALGFNAGVGQGVASIAIGSNAGRVSQGVDTIAIGVGAGATSQTSNSVAIGFSAGATSQGDNSVAIGTQAGTTTQGGFSVAIGPSAGITQGNVSVAIGAQAGQNSQSNYCVAIGGVAGQNNQDAYTVAIGYSAGNTNQKSGAVAIGWQAGDVGQSNDAVSIGKSAGCNSQGDSAIAIGRFSGNSGQAAGAIAIGPGAGLVNQQGIAIGPAAGSSNQLGIAIGCNAGVEFQETNCVAIGNSAGQIDQSNAAVAIGFSAGFDNQYINAIAIGRQAGLSNQRGYAIAIGSDAGSIGQKSNAIAVGYNAGQYLQGSNAIAIGNLAGQNNQVANSIVLNADSVALNGDGWPGFYVNPVRSNAAITGGFVHYDTATKELVFNEVGGGGSGGGITSTFTMQVYLSSIQTLGNLFINTQNQTEIIPYATGTARSYSGTIADVACSSNGSIVVVAEYTNGDILVSNNYGVSFSAPFNNNPIGYRKIAMSSNGAYILVAQGTVDKLLLSTDFGASFAPVEGANTSFTANFYSVAMSPDGQFMSAVGDNFITGSFTTKLFVSNNFGADGSWTVAHNFGAILAGVSGLAMNSSASKFIVTDGAVVRLSTNSGGSFNLVHFFSGPPAELIQTISYDPNLSYILIGTDSGFYVSTDDGDTFTNKTLGSPISIVHSAVSRTDGQYMVVSDFGNSTLYSSSNFGATWSAALPGAGGFGPQALSYNGLIGYFGSYGAGSLYYSEYDSTKPYQRIGVNTTTPAATLEISGSFKASSITVGVTSPSFTLQLGSDSAAKPTTNTWTVSSDERIKKDIVSANLTICLSTIQQIPLRYFAWDSAYYNNDVTKDRHAIGFIAQEVKTILPKAVEIISESMGLSDFHTLNVDQIYKMHVGATQKLALLVDASADFKGTHRCFSAESLTSNNGKIVIAAGGHAALHGGIPIYGLSSIGSAPLVSLSHNARDRRAFGVIAGDGGSGRVLVNSAGEGSIWVCEANGPVQNGDYITTSDVDGYGEKQGEEYVANFTVAKATMDCDFTAPALPKLVASVGADGSVSWIPNGATEPAYALRYVTQTGAEILKAEYTAAVARGDTVFRAALIGCTYHSG
jgi:hypothetical protein